jgi:predicted nucleic acid-binding protein
MSGKEILVDTNIILYLLAGNNTITEILQGKNIHFSFITELELLGFKDITGKEEKQVESLINEGLVIQMNNIIKQHYILLRKKYNLKLADAIIVATALALDIPLISADKQFKIVKELKLVTYEI